MTGVGVVAGAVVVTGALGGGALVVVVGALVVAGGSVVLAGAVGAGVGALGAGLGAGVELTGAGVAFGCELGEGELVGAEG